MDYDDDHPLRRYLLYWQDKRTVYQVLDVVLVFVTGGLWLGWLAGEAGLLWTERLDWPAAHAHYDDVGDGADYRDRGA